MPENRRTQNGRGRSRPEARQRAQSDGSSLAGSRREDCTDRGDRRTVGEGKITREGGNGQKAPLAARLGIPHWIIMAGAILVTVGVIGLAFNKNRNESQPVRLL